MFKVTNGITYINGQTGIYNGQLMTDEQIEHLIQVSLTEYIIPKLEKTGLP